MNEVNFSLIAQNSSDPPAIFVIAILALLVVMFAGMWKMLEKAGEPGWSCLVPIYNFVVLLRVADMSLWWIVVFLLAAIPFIGLIFGLVGGIVMGLRIAERFGKGTGFGLGLAFLGFIFYPILGFGDAEYQVETTPVYDGKFNPPNLRDFS
ncbi:MAG: DUF5684 domain-containing protein [Pirellulales bacterium]